MRRIDARRKNTSGASWREELETKFDIAFATTHDALLRSDPERFWSQKRLIASLVLARRSEHAAHIVGRSFDLVIVDEAHHLRDRTSQGYKLVDPRTTSLPDCLRSSLAMTIGKRCKRPNS